MPRPGTPAGTLRIPELPELGPRQAGRRDRGQRHVDAVPGPGRRVFSDGVVVDQDVVGVVMDPQELIILAALALVGLRLSPSWCV